MRRVLITGAGGFVGQAAIESLTEAGWQVRALVRRIPARASLRNVEWREAGDFVNFDGWKAALLDVNAVVHLAGRAHVRNDAGHDPLESYRPINVGVTRRLAVAAAAAGVRKFVFISSVKAMAERSGAQALIENETARPEDAYGISKREAEEALIDIHERTGLPVTILRPPLVYGPGVTANFLRLMRWVDRGVPLPLGAVRNRRSLVYVGNLVSALVIALEAERAGADVFFVSDNEDLSTPDLIRRLASALGRPARLVPVPQRALRGMLGMLGRAAEADRLLGSLCVDTSQIVKLLGWRPPYSLNEGLAVTVRAYRAGGRSGDGQ